MPSPLLAIVLALHGVVHFMGLVAYLRLGQVQGLPYKTTVLSGALDLGDVGMGIYGLLWGIAAWLFIVTSGALLMQAPWWRPLLLFAAVFSLILTALDWKVTFAGIVVNVMLLISLSVSGIGIRT
jgi:hypothetical protein